MLLLKIYISQSARGQTRKDIQLIKIIKQTCVEDLVEKTADEGGSDVKVGEE